MKTQEKNMRALMLFGGLLILAASPAFAQFEGGVNGLGDARQINMPTSLLWGTQPQAAPAAVQEEEEALAPVAPVKTKKKTTRH
jgi:hypothetical protein